MTTTNNDDNNNANDNDDMDDTNSNNTKYVICHVCNVRSAALLAATSLQTIVVASYCRSVQSM